jgi:hypothetical protein
VDERAGTTPFNLLPVAAGGTSGANSGHPATTPYDVAAWWGKYLLPEGGVLLDCFCGSGTMLAAGLDYGLPVQNPFPNHFLVCRRQKLLKRSDLAIPV